VRSLDNAGNSSAWSAGRYLQYDTAAPVVQVVSVRDSAVVPPQFRRTDPGTFIDINVTDPLSRLNEVSYRVTTGADGGGDVLIDWTPLAAVPANTSSFTENWALSAMTSSASSSSRPASPRTSGWWAMT
jgi:hypothetical protein